MLGLIDPIRKILFALSPFTEFHLMNICPQTNRWNWPCYCWAVWWAFPTSSFTTRGRRPTTNGLSSTRASTRTRSATRSRLSRSIPRLHLPFPYKRTWHSKREPSCCWQVDGLNSDLQDETGPIQARTPAANYKPEGKFLFSLPSLFFPAATLRIGTTITQTVFSTVISTAVNFASAVCIGNALLSDATAAKPCRKKRDFAHLRELLAFEEENRREELQIAASEVLP